MKNKDTNKTLIEIAWEVCNQVGGIYTVIRSKVPTMIQKWGDNYCLIGPYFNNNEFEPITNSDDNAFKAAQKLRESGYDVHYGYWLVSGKPKVILLNPFSAFHQLGHIKYEMWEHHGITSDQHDPLLDQVLAFGYLANLYIQELTRIESSDKKVIAHFHEWMAGLPIPFLRKSQVPVKILFTTHATLLGRYLAMNDPSFYDRLPFSDWEREAKHFNINTQVRLERAAAHGAHIFTTVSDVTARECIHLLGRKPEVILPNGLNIQRYEALHEFQSLHVKYKENIHRFVMGHFFQSYKFDLDKTLYFFTSGRFEYKNKGYDITLEALARLNHRMKEENIDANVVMFFITKQPVHSINVQVLESRAMMEELKETCDAIQKQVGEKLFYAATGSETDKLPNLSDFVDEYWRFRYRRTLQSWKSNNLPSIVTHNLVNDSHDEILNFLRTANLINHAHDKVKVVYHPDFINSTNPLFHMDYGQFVRGCHMGIFPSYYEPWGYTPLECIVRGVPAVTSDLSGFGDYVLKTNPEMQENGVYVVHRKNKSFSEAADELTQVMLDFVKLNRRERISLRNNVESMSECFDWKELVKYYELAYNMAMMR